MRSRACLQTIVQHGFRERVDTYGRDDADWLMMTGHARRYEPAGRWASWSITAVNPELLSETTAHLDNGEVRPNDKDQSINDTP